MDVTTPLFPWQSFDREELESEVQRRGSSSICSSGLFSLNLSDQGAVNVKIDPEAGYTCEDLHIHVHVHVAGVTASVLYSM